MKKPEVMYHASSESDIAEFEPRNESPRYVGEENLVFATPYKEVAAMFLVPRSIPAEISKYGDSYVVFVNGTENEFRSLDKGGAIYKLPADSFETNRDVGMGDTEWVSRRTVKPISKTLYKLSTEALRENGVNIYFLKDDVFQRVKANPSNGLDIVKSSKTV